MPVIGAINQCTNGSLKDASQPSDVVVNRAEWGDIVQARTSSKTIDPLILEMLEGIELKQGDRYSVWLVDRNGVEEKVVDAEFLPVACSPLELQLQGKRD